MKISVALCTYNGAKYIEDQIESIINQSLRIDELIICDDGSSDNTILIIKKLMNKHNVEYKLFRNEKALGVTKNFELACRNCTGDIIFFSDQDDVWLPHKVEKIIKEFNNNEAMLIFTNAYITKSDINTIIITSLWEKVGFTTNQMVDSFGNIMKQNYVTGATMAIRRELLDISLPFSESCYHDYWLALIASSKNKLFCLDEKLIYYRQHDNNQVGIADSKIKKVKNIYKSMNQLKTDYLNEKKVLDNLENYVQDELKKKIINRKKHFINIILEGKRIDILRIYIRGYFHKYSNGTKSFIKIFISK